MDYRDEYKYWKKKYLTLKGGKDTKNQRGGTASIDTIHFWARQMMEHCEFLFLGLEDANYNLKQHGAKLREAWKEFLDKTFYSRGIKVTLETIHLTQGDLQKVKDVPQTDVNKLLDQTVQYKQEILDAFKREKWIGWIFPGMVEHMIIEAKMFKRLVNAQPYSSAELIAFINDHHATELATTANLINPDPGQQYLIDVVRSYALRNMSFLKTNGSMAGPAQPGVTFPKDWTPQDEAVLKGLPAGEQATLLAISLKYSKEVTDFASKIGIMIDSKQLKSIIHPVLAHHVHREFVWFTELLEQLPVK